MWYNCIIVTPLLCFCLKEFELSLDKQVQAHPSLKALAVKGECSEPLVKGAVAGISKRGNVEKLIMKPSGRDPLLVCRQYAVNNGA